MTNMRKYLLIPTVIAALGISACQKQADKGTILPEVIKDTFTELFHGNTEPDSAGSLIPDSVKRELKNAFKMRQFDAESDSVYAAYPESLNAEEEFGGAIEVKILAGGNPAGYSTMIEPRAIDENKESEQVFPVVQQERDDLEALQAYLGDSTFQMLSQADIDSLKKDLQYIRQEEESLRSRLESARMTPLEFKRATGSIPIREWKTRDEPVTLETRVYEWAGKFVTLTTVETAAGCTTDTAYIGLPITPMFDVQEGILTVGYVTDLSSAPYVVTFDIGEKVDVRCRNW